MNHYIRETNILKREVLDIYYEHYTIKIGGNVMLNIYNSPHPTLKFQLEINVSNSYKRQRLAAYGNEYFS